MKNILSIHDGHNAAAAIFSDGKILSCIAEERLNREKFYWGWPGRSIGYVLKATGLTLDDIDAVTVSHLDTLAYIKRKFSMKENYVLQHALGHLYHIWTVFKRELKIRSLVRGRGRKKIFFCDHHLAHAASAYYYSGFEDALVVSIDAQGDGFSHTAYEVRKGQWKLLVNGGSNESLGAFYAALTEGLGFKPNRHEGKIVGLAAFADGKKLEEMDAFFVTASEDHLHFSRKSYQAMVEKVRELSQKFTREEISAYGQHLLEKLTIRHISKLCALTGLGNLALAGGVFSNVKLNQKITEQCPIIKIFIQPAMGDEGLVLGSAAYFLDKSAGHNINRPVHDVYYGNSYSDAEMESLLKAKGINYEILESPAQAVAKLLFEEKIVGWFDGKMEFGPRALGSRSIIVNPKRKEINDELNKRLNRSEFMPFAPSALFEKADEIFENVEPGRHAAEFMTITFNVRPEWRRKMDAVVHVDGTARPQLVKREKNPNYYDVINEFYKLSGVPVIVNTSFNMHEEPIVCTFEDAWRSFEVGAVDYLVLNNKFIIKK